MLRIIQFMAPMLLLNFSSYAIELFGYKLYEDISQYLNDGEVSYKKDSIDLSKQQLQNSDTQAKMKETFSAQMKEVKHNFFIKLSSMQNEINEYKQLLDE